MKFVHTADGRFGTAFDPGVRAALAEVRFDAIDTIGAAPDPGILNDQLVFSDDAPLDLMIETKTEAAERMQGILLACGDRAYRLVPANRISPIEAAK